MYAILKHGGHQYRVAPGDRLLVDRLTADVGSKVTLEPVLLVADGDAIADVGAAAVSGAHVVATVVAHRRGRKLRVFTYKPKKRRRRTLGYRSQLTELVVEEVAPGGGKPAARRAEEPAPEPAAAKAEPKAAAADPGAASPAAETAVAADAPAAVSEPKRRARRPAAGDTATAAGGDGADAADAPKAAAPDTEPEAAAAAPEGEVLDAPVETSPPKRAARSRRKADGA